MKAFLLYSVLCFLIINTTSGLYCWQQRCHECNKNDLKMNETKCELNGIVTRHWLDLQWSPRNPDENVNKELEYACITMVARNPKIVSDNTDIIRGCMLINDTNLCKSLDEEKNKEKTEFKCEICEKDFCNSASIPTFGVSIIFVMITFLLNFIRI